ncbi:uncharacterized protein BCR38DRAFT_102082 [Pseudomassariella vexata]|uniref:Uncharacterized protein n=1 Tax=Pseudomassariella vexata TaxID=1141098 RepID=A0A1Y2EF50_9PEZI|nr:uncharacterized protein BCR38DRAFT_102082 [Pseudomassariella vexata]ORY70201.1 hypothetical protein BCR38DRAFT_102082 [Pseudomassariella vexata]
MSSQVNVYLSKGVETLERAKISVLGSIMVVEIEAEAQPAAGTVTPDEKKHSEPKIETASTSSIRSPRSNRSEKEISNDGETPRIMGRPESFLRTVQRYIWDPDKPKCEKKFLLKLDFFLLTYICLAYFCKNPDPANINDAYIRYEGVVGDVRQRAVVLRKLLHGRLYHQPIVGCYTRLHAAADLSDTHA